MGILTSRTESIDGLVRAIEKKFGPYVKEFTIHVGDDQIVTITIIRYCTNEEGELIEALETIVKQVS